MGTAGCEPVTFSRGEGVGPDDGDQQLRFFLTCSGSSVAPRAVMSRAGTWMPVFTLARVMGTSVRMIERHYGALLDGAGGRDRRGARRARRGA